MSKISERRLAQSCILLKLFLKVVKRGEKGYNLFSIPTSFTRYAVQHGKVQAGEEVILEIINSKELRSFSDRCLLQSRRDRT